MEGEKMTLLQVIICLAGLAGIIYFVRKIIVDLGFPGNLIRAIISGLKRGQCPVCHKLYWAPRQALNCCKGTPGYEAWHREVERKQEAIRKGKEYSKATGRSPVGMPVEHDCPRCLGKPGNYMCPLCEGRGKTFIW